MAPRAGTVLFRVDASAAIGAGHAVRCLALAQALRDEGWCTLWLAAELPSWLEAQLQSEGIPVQRHTHPVGSAADAQACARHADSDGADWIVLDGYRFGADFRQRLAGIRAGLLVVDDEGIDGPLHCTALLNQNLHASPALYPASATATTLLLGTRHALLRRGFRTGGSRSPALRSRGRRVVVLAGGSDRFGLTALGLDALSQAGLDLEVCCVLGHRAGTRDPATVDTLAARLGASLLESVEDMRSLLDDADLAISAAGSTVWELLALGLPALLVSVAENQRPLAASVQGAGAGIDLGWCGNLRVETLVRELRALVGDPTARTRMGECGRALVDGQGAVRVAAYLRGRLGTPS